MCFGKFKPYISSVTCSVLQKENKRTHKGPSFLAALGHLVNYGGDSLFQLWYNLRIGLLCEVLKSNS